MKWLWLLARDPLAAFDLEDANGGPDHGKLAGFMAFWVFVILIWLDRVPPLGHTIVMFSAAFGSRAFMAFLRSRTVTAAAIDTTTTTVTHQILERRDATRGVEPTP